MLTTLLITSDDVLMTVLMTSDDVLMTVCLYCVELPKDHRQIDFIHGRIHTTLFCSSLERESLDCPVCI